MQLPTDSSQPGGPGYAAPSPAKGGGSKTVIIVVVVLLVLCCCCALVGTGVYLYQNGDEIMRQINSLSEVPWGILPLA